MCEWLVSVDFESPYSLYHRHLYRTVREEHQRKLSIPVND